jgi:hypothetical protein
MKYQISLSVKIFAGLVLCSALGLTGCTKNYDQINTDPTRLGELKTEDIAAVFTNAEYMAMYSGDNSSEYQYAQGFAADLYAQYSAITATFDPTDRYNIEQEWIQEQWLATYTKALPAVYSILATTTTPDLQAMNAIARIWRVWIYHRATDYYGPIPYSKVGIDSASIPYDAQKDIYMDLFKEITEATDQLKNNLEATNFGSNDKIYGGDNAKWLKFGNTLRLRLAMRISYVEPEMAKEEAEAAVANGTMTDLEDDAYLQVSPVNYNGFNRQASWNEFRMSAAMQSILGGFQDPRMSKFWSPSVIEGEYTGVRNGMNTEEIAAEENTPDHNSGVSVPLSSDNLGTTPSTVMHAAEAYFLKAEGALNGWNMGGTAKDFYEKGIEMSMGTWGITDGALVNNYINSTHTPTAPGGYFNSPALSDITVKFDTDPERQREQILTQKWISLFPEGHEAWAEERRTGYPKLYPLIHSDNPDLPVGHPIKRIPFIDYDRDRNGPAVEAAAALLGGPDNGATRMWWDVR